MKPKKETEDQKAAKAAERRIAASTTQEMLQEHPWLASYLPEPRPADEPQPAAQSFRGPSSSAGGGRQEETSEEESEEGN
eukprot:10781455-Lingulodinium_polyedra.AAC.1